MTSNALPNPSNRSADTVKHILAGLLVAAGVAGYYLIGNAWPAGVRMILVAVAVIAAGAVFMTTAKGLQARGFLSESRFELRKVVWPTRQETNRMMLIVILAVLAFSLIMAAFDWVIQIGVKWLLGS